MKTKQSKEKLDKDEEKEKKAKPEKKETPKIKVGDDIEMSSIMDIFRVTSIHTNIIRVVNVTGTSSHGFVRNFDDTITIPLYCNRIFSTALKINSISKCKINQTKKEKV